MFNPQLDAGSSFPKKSAILKEFLNRVLCKWAGIRMDLRPTVTCCHCLLNDMQ